MINVLEWIRGALTLSSTTEGPQGLVLHTFPGEYSVDEHAPSRGRRNHTFSSIGSFAAWLNRHAEPTVTEILVGDRSAQAGLNPEVPNADVVGCTLVVHPRAQRWLDALGTRMSQRDFYRLIVTADEDLGEACDPSGNVVGRAAGLLAAEVSKMRIVRGGEYNAELDDRGNYRMRGGTDTVETKGRLPSRIEVTVPWFLDVHREDIVADHPGSWVEALYILDLHVEIDTETNPKAPAFILRAPGLDLLKHEARQDACTWLVELLDEGFLVGLGAFAASKVRDFSA